MEIEISKLDDGYRFTLHSGVETIVKHYFGLEKADKDEIFQMINMYLTKETEKTA